MRNIAILSALALMGTVAAAQEQARVISSTPVIQQVAIPQQVCRNETIYNGNSQPSGAGAVLGALAGVPLATPLATAADAPRPRRWAS